MRRVYPIVTGGKVVCDEPGCGWSLSALTCEDALKWENVLCPKCHMRVIVTEPEAAIIRKLLRVQPLAEHIIAEGGNLGEPRVFSTAAARADIGPKPNVRWEWWARFPYWPQVIKCLGCVAMFLLWALAAYGFMSIIFPYGATQ